VLVQSISVLSFFLISSNVSYSASTTAFSFFRLYIHLIFGICSSFSFLSIDFTFVACALLILHSLRAFCIQCKKIAIRVATFACSTGDVYNLILLIPKELSLGENVFKTNSSIFACNVASSQALIISLKTSGSIKSVKFLAASSFLPENSFSFLDHLV
jgi:hypothetical protein